MFGLKHSGWQADCIDWIGEAIQGIGYHAGFETVPLQLEVKNFRCNIPNGLESLNFIEYNGHRLPLGIDKSDYGFVNKSNGGFRPITNYQEMLQLNKEIDRLAVLQQQLINEPNNIDIINAIIDANFKINQDVMQLRLAAYAQYAKEFYNIDGDYIKCSFESGVIQINAEAFLCDNQGYPRVIDTFKYIKAVEWYLIQALILQGYKHPELSWKEAYAMWDGDGGAEKGFRMKASNEQKMPDIDQLERFTQRWQSVKREAVVQHEIDFLQ